MSGECPKCHEHAVDCKCNGVCGSKWISVKKRLPKEGEAVGYVFCHGYIRTDVEFDAGAHLFIRDYGKSGIRIVDEPVTHWMPLPEPPGDDDE